MRTRLIWLAIGIGLLSVWAAIIRASTLDFEEADLHPYSNAYELNSGTDGDVYVTDSSAGEIWQVSATGAYTSHQLFLEFIDARPDSAGDIWWAALDTFGRVNVHQGSVTKWSVPGAFGLWGSAFDDQGRVWFTEETGSLSRFDSTSIEEAGSHAYRFDPISTEVCSYTVSAYSSYIVVQQGFVWLGNWGNDRIYRLDPAADQADWWVIPGANPRPAGLALDDEGTLWFADSGLGSLISLDADQDLMTEYPLPLGTKPQMIDIREDGIWYTEDGSGTIGVLDPATASGIPTTPATGSLSVVETCTILGAGTTNSINAVTGNLDWAAATLEPAYDQGGWLIYELPSGAGPWGITSASGYVWASDVDRSKLLRLSPAATPVPGIHLEKFTNGQDADSAPGPFVAVGEPVTWTYVVSNTGNVDLTAVTVTDDNGTPSDPSDDYSCPIGYLAAGEADGTTCSQTGAAAAGQYENVALAAGDYAGSPVTGGDLSHYYGASTSVELGKQTNGIDADSPPGPAVPVGDAVEWTYTVTNTSNVSLTNLSVIDDQQGAVCTIQQLDPGEVTACAANGFAVAGQYANIGTVAGTPGNGLPDVTADDPSHYFGTATSIRLQKQTNGHDADDPPGPTIPAGDPVEWTYAVTNTSNAAISNLIVTDDKLGTICTIQVLDPGESVTCNATGFATGGQYANLGSVVGTPDGGLPDVSDDDASHYFGLTEGWSVFLPVVINGGQ